MGTIPWQLVVESYNNVDYDEQTEMSTSTRKTTKHIEVYRKLTFLLWHHTGNTDGDEDFCRQYRKVIFANDATCVLMNRDIFRSFI